MRDDRTRPDACPDHAECGAVVAPLGCGDPVQTQPLADDLAKRFQLATRRESAQADATRGGGDFKGEGRRLGRSACIDYGMPPFTVREIANRVGDGLRIAVEDQDRVRAKLQRDIEATLVDVTGPRLSPSRYESRAVFLPGCLFRLAAYAAGGFQPRLLCGRLWL